MEDYSNGLTFSIPVYGSVHIGPLEIYITHTLVATFVISLVLIAFAIVVRIKLNKFTDKPSGFQNFIEWAIEVFDRFVRNAAGDKMYWLGGWFFTVFLFLLVANTVGMFGVRPPSADWPVPLTLALCTFALLWISGIKYKGTWGYIKETYFHPHFLFFPINLLGELARPVSLSFRMFGNVLAGLILLSLLYGLAPVFLRFLLPVPLHIYFDLVSGGLQAFVFTILSLSYLGMAASTEEV